MKKILLTASILATFVFAPAAHAEEDKGARFSIDPGNIELECTPGENVVSSFNLENPKSYDQSYRVELVGYKILQGKDTGLSSVDVSATDASSLARHIKLESELVAIPAKTTKTINFTVNAPQVAGTQYAAIRIVTTDASRVDKTNRSGEYTAEAGAGFEAAFLFTIKCNMKGTLKPSIKLNDVVFSSKPNQPIQARGMFENNGNAELRFIPIMLLTDSSKRVVARMKGQKMVTLLPGTTQAVEFEPTVKPIAKGNYQAVISLSSPESGLQLAPITKQVVVK